MMFCMYGLVPDSEKVRQMGVLVTSRPHMSVNLKMA